MVFLIALFIYLQLYSRALVYSYIRIILYSIALVFRRVVFYVLPSMFFLLKTQRSRFSASHNTTPSLNHHHSTPIMPGTTSSRGDDPPLAIGEDITHTNLVMSDDHLMAPRHDTAPRLPPLKLPIVKAERPFVASLDSDPVDGLVRQEVLSCDVAGLGIHELLVLLFQAAAPPHVVVVSTDAPEDALPERWEAQVGFPKKIFNIMAVGAIDSRA